jgi:CHAT domain-containing protein
MNIRYTSRHQWFTRSRTSRRILLILVLLALIAAGWSFRSFYLRKSAVTTGLEALVAAYEGRRPLQARISGLAYAPFISRRGESGDFDPVNRDLAERLLLEAVAENPTSSARQALGQFYLMSGSPAKAMVQFEEALKEDSSNSSLRNDFAVALMEMSHKSPAIDSDNTLLYAAKALEQFESAVKLNSANVEALHNRALLLDQMKLPEQRDQAWQTYLARETNHDWTTEAKRTIQSLSQTDSDRWSRTHVLESFVSATLARDDERSWRELTRNKDMIAETFIPQELAYSFLIATANNNSAEAKNLLNAFRYAGKLELEKAGDPFVSEIAGHYARATAEQQKLLHAAHVLLRNGYAACRTGNYDSSMFDEARKLFLRAGDVWEAKICEYWIAYCLSQKTDIAKSTELLTSLAKFSQAKHYHWLEAQAICWIANNHTELREYSRSLESYDAALSIAAKINDVYNQQKILSQSGNSYLRLGQPERALQYDWRALQLIDPASGSVRQTWRTYLYTTRALAALGLFEAAAQYGAAMLNLAVNNLKDPATIHFSDLYLAQINGGKKNFPEAIRLASESLKIADSLKDPANAFKLRTGSLLLLAHLQRQSGAIEQALNSYNEAINNYDRMEPSIYKYDALKGRLLSYVALNDSAKFESQLPTVLEEFEKHRVNIFEEQNRNTFFDREQSVYDLAINHELEKHDNLSALNYSEQSRARSLLKALTEKKANGAVTASAPLHPAELQRQLPANLQVLQYAVLEDKLIVWLITNNRIESKTRNIRADELRSLVTEYVKGISSGPGKADKLRAVSQRLYDVLVGPFREDLDPSRVLCIVPDKILSYVPFDALISPASQRYLISEFSLLSSPSLNVLVHCTSTAKDYVTASGETLLSIGNPSFDRRQYPELDDLPAAAREAAGIASNYSKSYQLIGPEAVKKAVEKQLPTADVIHFAGHYVTNESQPLLSKLVLAKQKGSENGDLTLGELVSTKLPRTKLVVLSACETSGKEYYNGEGLIGIARTFLRTGIPLVVASQWSVESESTAQLMLKFHRYRKIPGVSSLAALRKAQLELLEDPNGLFSDPYYWAAFTTVGGYADF